jgi:hypothetical protein
LPKFYGASYRNALRADAAHLNLSSQSEFYFDVGVQLSQLLEDESSLGKGLIEGFAHRFAHGILDASLNVTNKSDSTAIKEKLTLREKQLFDAGREAAAQYTAWKAEKTRGRIHTSALVRAEKGRRGKKRARGS